ncbi:unnamed protein product [Rhizoctonia solani]|uniref:Uncharacterized protein n=1 Tax=Rhizoctonia solani TaxID=456999 RepID=A0A8H3DXP5_9AGAM|nr:unnamed protein product [Rhizoctonia solani]
MTSSSVRDIQNVWGRVLPDYVGSYATKATSAHAPLDPAAASSLRIRVTTAINEITRLGTSECCSNVALSITLSMLGDILDIVNIPDEFGLLADPRIIAGCVSLMTTVDVSPFHYDYGYVSFRILVLALNCCLLRHIGRLNHVMWRMKAMPVSLRLHMFWEESATMIAAEVRGGAGLSDLFDSGTFNQYGLDRLLDLLHTSEKDFLVVMKSTKSIGLSGLMFVFSKQIEVERYVLCLSTVSCLII